MTIKAHDQAAGCVAFTPSGPSLVKPRHLLASTLSRAILDRQANICLVGNCEQHSRRLVDEFH
jgi:hypothetical protein